MVIFDAKRGEFLAREFEPDFEYVFELFKTQTPSKKAARAGHKFDENFSARAIRDFQLDFKSEFNATKSPKPAMRAIFPLIFCPGFRASVTFSHGSFSRALRLKLTFERSGCCVFQSAFMIFASIFCPTLKTSETSFTRWWLISLIGRRA